MTVQDLRDAIRPVPPVSPQDSIGKAIRLMRSREVPALPVADAGRLVGMVHEGDVMAVVASAVDGRRAAGETRVGEVMRETPFAAHEYHSLEQVAEVLTTSRDAATLVVSAEGRYRGLLLRRDVMAALAGEAVMPQVAGLATPGGVYLTTGALRAGAGDGWLVATGVTLTVLSVVANLAVFGLDWLLGEVLPAEVVAKLSAAQGDGRTLLILIASLLQVGLFLLLLRLSPLAGIHAAEHMVVHTIEAGEEVALEKVKAMPRVHPRCGTNLMALLVLLVIGQQLLDSVVLPDKSQQMFALLALVMVIIMTWRRLGAGLQRWITTRAPSERQLTRAMAVGNDLLSKIRARPSARAGRLRRIWNLGFLQVVAGFMVTTIAVEQVARWVLKLGGHL